MGRGPGVRAVGRSIQIDFRYKGGRCRERLRLEPNVRNLRFAANLKARIEHDIALGVFEYGKYFPDSKRIQDRSTALVHHLDRFLLRVKVSPETAQEYGESVAAVPSWLLEKPIASVTQQDIENWLDPLDLSRKRITNLLIPLRGAFRKALRDGEIKHNPLIGLRTNARKTEANIDPFSRDEVEALSKTRGGNVWKFWAWTGVRSGELAGLEWRDVEASFDYVFIRRSVRMGREKQPKTTSGLRRIRLLEHAQAALGERKKGPIFLNPATVGRYESDRQIREAFRRACAESGVRYRYPYQLRHTFASWALSSGENPLWVAKQIGHKDVSMVLRVYGRYIPEMDPLAGTRMIR